MSDDRAISSPCTGVCNIHAQTQLCEGCLRTLDEIAGWSSFDSKTQLQVLRTLKGRRLAGESAATYREKD